MDWYGFVGSLSALTLFATKKTRILIIETTKVDLCLFLVALEREWKLLNGNALRGLSLLN